MNTISPLRAAPRALPSAVSSRTANLIAPSPGRSPWRLRAREMRRFLNRVQAVIGTTKYTKQRPRHNPWRTLLQVQKVINHNSRSDAFLPVVFYGTPLCAAIGLHNESTKAQRSSIPWFDNLEASPCLPFRFRLTITSRTALADPSCKYGAVR